MAKEGKFGIVTRFLIRAGSALQFAPKEACSAPLSEEEEKPGRFHRAQPYFLKIKTSLAKSSEESFLLGLLRRGLQGFFLTRMRALGVFFFLNGFLQLLSYFFGKSVTAIPLLAGDYSRLVFGVFYIFLALLCTFAKGTVGEQVKKSFLFKGLLAPMFGARTYHIPVGAARDSMVFMISAGIVCGIVSVVVSPFALLEGILLLAVAAYLFCRPEVGLILVGGLFFVLPPKQLSALVLLTLVSLLCKCAVGKRSLSFAWQDGVMAFCTAALAIIFDGIASFYLLILFCLYLLVPALLRNLQSLHDLVRFLCLTAGIGGLLVTARAALELFWPSILWRFPQLERVLFLEPTEGIGILFAMVLPQVLGMAIATRKPAKKVFAFFCTLSLGAALVMIRSGNAWLCALFGVVIFILLAYRAGLLTLIVLGLATFCAVQVLPPEKMLRILSFFGMQEDFFFSHGHSFLSRALETAGGFSAVLLAVALVWFLYECFLFSRDATVAVAYPPVLSALCGVAVLAAALFSPVGLNEVHLTFFFLLAAIPRAAAWSAKREEIRFPY